MIEISSYLIFIKYILIINLFASQKYTNQHMTSLIFDILTRNIYIQLVSEIYLIKMRNLLRLLQNLNYYKNFIAWHYLKRKQNHLLENLFLITSILTMSIILIFIQLFLPIGFEMIIILSIVIVNKSAKH